MTAPFPSRPNMNPEKWGNFGDPGHPAFWMAFLGADTLCVALIYFLLF